MAICTKMDAPLLTRVPFGSLRIFFDLDFDHGVWPGPRPSTSAVAGVAWLGPDGFLACLETFLGLVAPRASLADRASELVPRLFQADRFYGRSAQTDPWATAHRLLAWRDELWAYGWRGESLGERRLGDLAEVTLGVPRGPVERLEIVAGWLETRAVDIEELRLLVDRTAFSPAWQRVFVALERAGTRIVVGPFPSAHAPGNLATFRGETDGFSADDRSVQLLRPHGPREAARLVAAALAADPAFDQTVFVGPDGLLDEALAEFGLPPLGARSMHETSALAALLPLTLQLAWGPVDPQTALDWLTLPDLPIDRSLATRLTESLAVWPAVGNPSWRAIVDALPSSDPARAVLQAIFVPLADRQAQIRVRHLLPRVELLEQWARQHASSPAHTVVVSQAEALRGRFALAELHRLSPPKLDAVLASVIGDGATIRQLACAGYHAVGLPGGIAGSARRIVWWNFHHQGSRPTNVALRVSEQRALAGIGLTLPKLGAAVRAAALRARRPLLHTEGTLLLVAPHHEQTGEPAHPHSLWDEIIGRLPNPLDQHHLLVSEPQFRQPLARTAIRISQTAPAPRDYQTSLPLAPRAVDSPSSLTKLLGCSYSYALDYVGRLRPAPSPRLVVESRLHGLLAHEVLAAAAREGVLPGRTHDDVRQAVLSILDAYLPTHAALLLLHGHHQDLVHLRDALGGTAELLSRLMHADGLRIHAVEQELQAEVRGRSLRGTPDIVLIDDQKRLILLDFKWSGENYRREELRAGTSLQLSAYAMLLNRAGHFVRSMGYLILRSQRLLIRGEPVAFAERVRPDGLGETWIAAEQAWADRNAEVASGRLVAAGVTTQDDKPIKAAQLERGRLLLPAPCLYCKLDLLCGKETGSR